MLLEPQVWLDAACQIFFSFGLAFGGIIAMASYNPRKNDCRRDAISVTICNCATGLFAASIIFSILGSKAYDTAGGCVAKCACVPLLVLALILALVLVLNTLIVCLLATHATPDDAMADGRK